MQGMKETISQEKAVQMALDHAASPENPPLVTADGFHNLSGADQSNSDTIYSIASMFSQFCEEEDEARSAILSALTNQYGQRYA